MNNKVYIGSAVRFTKRFESHRRQLRNNKHANKHLQSSYNEHGKDNFIFEKILICEPKDLLMYEQKFMDFYKSYDKEFGYNIRRKAESNIGLPSPNKGKKLTEAQKEHLRQINLGKKHSDETKELVRISSTGRKHTQEAKDKISKNRQGIGVGVKMDKDMLVRRTETWFKNKEKIVSEGGHYGRPRPTEEEIEITNKKKSIKNITKKLNTNKKITPFEEKQMKEALLDTNFNI